MKIEPKTIDPTLISKYAKVSLYTIPEWKSLLSDLFIVDEVAVYGSKSQLIPLPYGRIKQYIMDLIPNSVGRYITNRPQFGFLLVSSALKK